MFVASGGDGSEFLAVARGGCGSSRVWSQPTTQRWPCWHLWRLPQPQCPPPHVRHTPLWPRRSPSWLHSALAVHPYPPGRAALRFCCANRWLRTSAAMGGPYTRLPLGHGCTLRVAAHMLLWLWMAPVHSQLRDMACTLHAAPACGRLPTVAMPDDQHMVTN